MSVSSPVPTITAMTWLWPWTVTTAARRGALARRSRQSAVQGRKHGAPMSAEPSTEIPGRLLRSDLRRHQSSTSQRSASRHRLTVPHIRSQGLLCWGPDDLERTARRSPRLVAQYQWLQANIKDSNVHYLPDISVSSTRLRCFMKFTDTDISCDRIHSRT